MYTNILFPTDGGPVTSIVADHVGELAAEYDATVHVLSVADSRNRFDGPNAGVGSAVWNEAQQEQAEEAMTRAVEELPDGVEHTRQIQSGVPSAEIISYATDAEIDLIVMGTHGRTGVDHYLIGSIAERVVRKSPVPVLTVGTSADTATD
ncbi:MAG: universal stress protein UspA related nucleotide-binding protein [Halonotius sp. J07HN6]|nr:MAG: universal stress protein UspA related nucleotide-binding protein [Halonotius sp. J07HN6]ESS08055.1 MAG: universal stress protein UspA related nucleotide-binding protein [uncultured archaeon A07HN63]